MKLAALPVFGKRQTHCGGGAGCPGRDGERERRAFGKQGERAKENKLRFSQTEASRLSAAAPGGGDKAADRMEHVWTR